MPLEPPYHLSPRAYQLAEVVVLRDEYTPLAQRALYHLFPGYPLGGFGDRPFPQRCWRWSAGSWFDSMVVIEGNGVRKSGLPRTGLLARNKVRFGHHPTGILKSVSRNRTLCAKLRDETSIRWWPAPGHA